MDMDIIECAIEDFERDVEDCVDTIERVYCNRQDDYFIVINEDDEYYLIWRYNREDNYKEAILVYEGDNIEEGLDVLRVECD